MGVDHTLHLTTAVNSFLKLKESMIIHGKAYRTQHTADYIILYYYCAVTIGGWIPPKSGPRSAFSRHI